MSAKPAEVTPHAVVRAKAKGYHIGPREKGDEFQMPLDANGNPPKGSWFDVVKVVKGRSDDELA